MFEKGANWHNGRVTVPNAPGAHGLIGQGIMTSKGIVRNSHACAIETV
jgi:hypothetical protein